MHALANVAFDVVSTMYAVASVVLVVILFAGLVALVWMVLDLVIH